MAETKLLALAEVTRACHRCCGLLILNVSGELLCSLGRENNHAWRQPPGGCPIPKLYRKVGSGKTAPETVTEEYVEARRPRHDGQGNWLKGKPEEPAAEEPEPAAEEPEAPDAEGE